MIFTYKKKEGSTTIFFIYLIQQCLSKSEFDSFTGFILNYGL